MGSNSLWRGSSGGAPGGSAGGVARSQAPRAQRRSRSSTSRRPHTWGTLENAPLVSGLCGGRRAPCKAAASRACCKVVADPYAAQAIGALTHLAVQRFTCVRAGHQPQSLRHVGQCLEGFLSLPGVIAILLGHTRGTRHGHAPVVLHTRGSISGASGWVGSAIWPATSVVYAVHRPTGQMGTRPLRHALLGHRCYFS